MDDEALAKRRQAITAAGKIQVLVGTKQIEVISPYHEDFVKAAKELRGYWEAKRQCWVFNVYRRSAVLELVRRIYGDRSQYRRCPGHRYVRVEAGIRCLVCGLFKERSVKV